MNRIPLAVPLVLMGMAAACGSPGDSGTAAGGPGPIVRDSAGVRVVENPEPDQSHWRVGRTLYMLGWGPDDPQFTWIQSGRILPDGAVLIGEFGEGRIYRIGPDGSVLQSWGRKGEGPGEYQALDAILLQGDTILVSDARLRRMTVLSAEGEMLTTHPMQGAFLHEASSVLQDGRILLIPGDAYMAVPETRPEWVFQEQPILAAEPGASRVDTLLSLPHLKRWYGDRGGSPGPLNVKGRAGGLAEGFAWARSDEPEVRWYDASGELQQIARWAEPPVPLISEFKEEMVRNLEEVYRSRAAEESFIAARLSDVETGLDRHQGPVPYWRWLDVDRLGNVWLSDYTMPGHPPGRWRVVTRDGEFQGWVDLPEIRDILDITDDRILGVRLNDMDVPALVLMELVKGE